MRGTSRERLAELRAFQRVFYRTLDACDTSADAAEFEPILRTYFPAILRKDQEATQAHPRVGG
jgi:hypothetical protein